MKRRDKIQGLSTDQYQDSGDGSVTAREVRVVGISRRIWAILAIMSLLVVGLAFAYFRAQGALDTSRTTLNQAIEQAKLVEIALKHETEAKEQAIADREQLVKELSSQGDKLAEFSRGEEQAKTQAEQASTGVEAAEKRIMTLRVKLKAAGKEITALTSELEVMRGELDRARADVEIWRSKAEPYGPAGQPAAPPAGQ